MLIKRWQILKEAGESPMFWIGGVIVYAGVVSFDSSMLERLSFVVAGGFFAGYTIFDATRRLYLYEYLSRKSGESDE